VRLGLSANYNTLNVPNTTSDTRVSGTAVELDLELGAFRRKGIWLLAEATTGENLASLQTFWGAQGVASYFHPIRLSRVEGVEPVMRVSWADPDDSNDLDAGVLYTPGFNVYFVGRNRLMFNVDIYQPQDDRIGTTYALRSQFNVYF
jgi:hypothetical protein